jgi:uncharacterized repeat protein (TIGR02543 family)
MKKYLALVLAVVAALTACDNGADAPQEELARIRIGAVSGVVSDTRGVNTRSVLPTAPALEDVEWFALYGTASGKAQTDPTYQESWLADLAYQDGIFYYRNDEGRKNPAVVYLRPGDWRFTLYAYQGEDAALKGTATITITASFNGTVNFTLSLYSEVGSTGSVSICLDLPEGSGVASVETTIDGAPLDQALAVDAGAVVYENGETPAGQYLFSFVLKNSAGKTILVVSDVVVVTSGAKSAKEYALAAADFNAPPAAPSALTIASYNAENQTLHFTWQDNSFNETGFILSDGTTTSPIDAATQSFDFPATDPTASATYTLKAVNSFGESAPAQISGIAVVTVTFDMDNGNAAQTRRVINGGSIGVGMPANPTRTNYIFGGWYTAQNGGGSAFTAGTTITSDLTAYAKWIDLYTVTFDADGGSPATQTRTVIDGGTLGTNTPSAPTKTGYTFDGWYTAQNGGGSALTADTTVNGNITVYAKWAEGVKYELTKNPDDNNYISNTDDLLPPGFIVDAGEEVTVSFSIRTDTTMMGFYVGIGDWNNSASYNDGEDGWIASGWRNTKSVSADGQFHAYTWTMTANADAPVGGEPLVFRFAMNGVSKDKVAVYVKDVSVTKSPSIFSNLSFAESLAWITENAEEGGDYTIILKNSEPIAPQTFSYSGKNVSITLNGSPTERILSLSANGSLTIESGVTLTLGNKVALQGRNSNTTPLVYVNAGGALTMGSGSKVSGNTSAAASSSTYAYGGGVYVNGGVFTMNGGEISGNSASAVFSASTSASAYGGGVYVNSGVFTMNGGEISGNRASSSTYAAYISASAAAFGGGVYVNNGVFTMNGGEISGNRVSASADTSSSRFYSSYAYAHGGGVAVYSSGTFTQSGGIVNSNSSSASAGSSASASSGGVYVYGTFTQSGGTISGNTADYGGGVYVGGTFTKQSGGTIYGSDASDTLKNTAPSGNGHAVYVSSGSKTRNSTAGVGVTLNSAISGAAGGWE